MSSEENLRSCTAPLIVHSPKFFCGSTAEAEQGQGVGERPLFSLQWDQVMLEQRGTLEVIRPGHLW